MRLLVAMASIVMSTPAVRGVEPVKFAIASDFHAPDVPGGLERVEAFVDHATAEQADFIIELGDFARLDSANRCYLDAWNRFPGYRYHVIGNHDCDSYAKERYAAGIGMPGRYYSFDRGDFHFIVLDNNNWADGQGNIHPYDHGNYYGKSTDWMDPQQIEWLKRDLASTDKRCVLFSHQSIDFRLKNGEAVRAILEQENNRAGFSKVALVFSGHDHSNYHREINGINYVQINSASYVWIGKDTRSDKRFPPEINNRYGLMKYSMMYEKPLWAVVTLTGEGAEIRGVKSRFIPPSPEEVGITENVDGLPLTPSIEDITIRFGK